MTYEEFLEAWYPDKGFGFGGRGPRTARSVDDERENPHRRLYRSPEA
jgi:hypothetical protein